MISKDIKGAVVGFIMHLQKGMVDDDRWDWTMEKVDSNWQSYREAFFDPTIMRTTMSIFMNTLNEDASNYEDAKFRAFQFFRRFNDGYIVPFTLEEMEEPNWYTWG